MEADITATLLTVAGPNALAAFVGWRWLLSMQKVCDTKDAIIEKKDLRIKELTDTLINVAGEVAKTVTEFASATRPGAHQ